MPSHRSSELALTIDLLRAFGPSVKDVYFGGGMEASLAVAGQTVGLIHEVLPVADIIARTVEGFHAIRREQGMRSAGGEF